MAAKLDTSGKKKFYYGYKLHLLADTQYEIPVAAKVASASLHDSRAASHVLQQARYTYSKFHPEYVICDAGYSSEKLRHLIKRQYRAEPIIKVNPSHKKALSRILRQRNSKLSITGAVLLSVCLVGSNATGA